MTNKEHVPHVINWQVAYAARELRHKQRITISCLASEAGSFLEQLSSFCNSRPIMTNSVIKPNSNELFLEIVNAY